MKANSWVYVVVAVLLVAAIVAFVVILAGNEFEMPPDFVATQGQVATPSPTTPPNAASVANPVGPDTCIVTYHVQYSSGETVLPEVAAPSDWPEDEVHQRLFERCFSGAEIIINAP